MVLRGRKAGRSEAGGPEGRKAGGPEGREAGRAEGRNGHCPVNAAQGAAQQLAANVINFCNARGSPPWQKVQHHGECSSELQGPRRLAIRNGPGAAHVRPIDLSPEPGAVRPVRTDATRRCVDPQQRRRGARISNQPQGLRSTRPYRARVARRAGDARRDWIPAEVLQACEPQNDSRVSDPYWSASARASARLERASPTRAAERMSCAHDGVPILQAPRQSSFQKPAHCESQRRQSRQATLRPTMFVRPENLRPFGLPALPHSDIPIRALAIMI